MKEFSFSCRTHWVTPDDAANAAQMAEKWPAARSAEPSVVSISAKTQEQLELELDEDLKSALDDITRFLGDGWGRRPPARQFGVFGEALTLSMLRDEKKDVRRILSVEGNAKMPDFLWLDSEGRTLGLVEVKTGNALKHTPGSSQSRPCEVVTKKHKKASEQLATKAAHAEIGAHTKQPPRTVKKLVPERHDEAWVWLVIDPRLSTVESEVKSLARSQCAEVHRDCTQCLSLSEGIGLNLTRIAPESASQKVAGDRWGEHEEAFLAYNLFVDAIRMREPYGAEQAMIALYSLRERSKEGDLLASWTKKEIQEYCRGVGSRVGLSLPHPRSRGPTKIKVPEVSGTLVWLDGAHTVGFLPSDWWYILRRVAGKASDLLARYRKLEHDHAGFKKLLEAHDITYEYEPDDRAKHEVSVRWRDGEWRRGELTLLPHGGGIQLRSLQGALKKD